MVAADVASPSVDTALERIVTDVSGWVSEQDVRRPMDRFQGSGFSALRTLTRFLESDKISPASRGGPRRVAE